MQFSYEKIWLLLICFFFITPAFCGEQAREEYETARQALIGTLTQTRDNLRTLRQQFPSDQAFDRAITADKLNQLLQALPQAMRTVVSLVFSTTDNPTLDLRRINFLLKFFREHPYDEKHGAHLMELLGRFIHLSQIAAAAQDNLKTTLSTASPNQMQGITLMYMITYNRILKDTNKLLDDMALVD